MKRALAAAFGVIVVVALVWATVARATTKTVAVDRGELAETLVATAVVSSIDGVAHVAARVDGRVAKVLVREGERVEQGQVLAELDPEEYETTLARADAERKSRVAAANADLVAARHAYTLALDRAKRTRQLLDSGTEGAASAHEAATSVALARAEVARAQAARDLALGGKGDDRLKGSDAAMDGARRHFEWTKVVAPMAGSILARRIDVGDTVSAASGAVLFEIANPDRTELTVEIEESDASRVSQGLEVDVVTPGGKAAIAHGRITRVSPALHKRTIAADEGRFRGDSVVRTAWVEWTDAAKEPVPLGMRLEAIVKLPPSVVDARVPRSAVVVRDGQARVKVLHGPVALEKVVVLGRTDDRWVEVKNLAPGTKVADAWN